MFFCGFFSFLKDNPGVGDSNQEDGGFVPCRMDFTGLEAGRLTKSLTVPQDQAERLKVQAFSTKE